MNADKIVTTYGAILKQNVGLSLSLDECEELVASVVTECNIKSQQDNKELVNEMQEFIDNIDNGSIKLTDTGQEPNNISASLTLIRFKQLIQKHSS